MKAALGYFIFHGAEQPWPPQQATGRVPNVSQGRAQLAGRATLFTDMVFEIPLLNMMIIMWLFMGT